MYFETINERGGIAGAGAEAEGAAAAVRSINLRDIWAPIYRSRFGIAAIVVVVLGLTAVITVLTRPIYRTGATIEIRQEAQKVLGTEDTSSETGGSADIDRFLDTQLDIIRSRSTVEAVAQSLGLYRGSAFLDGMGVKDPKTGNAILSADEAHRETVNGTLRRGLRVSFFKNTRIANIEFASPDPRVAAQIANSFADNYIRQSLERRFDASRYSLEFLRNQLREAQARLSNSERQALAYARQTRLIDASAGAAGGNAPRSLTTSSLVDLNASLSQATSRRIAAEQRWDNARAANVLTLPEVLGNPAIQQLLAQLAQLRSQYQDQLQTRREVYPALQQQAAHIAELNRQANALAERVRASINEEYQTALRQENGLKSDLEGLKNATLDEQARGIRLSILQREANTNRVQLDALLNRYNQVNAQAGVQLNNLAVIDHAQVPTAPYWPSIPLNFALALLAAAVLSAAFVLGRENLFELVRSPDDVLSRLHLPLLGAVPEGQDVVADLKDPKSGISEAFSSIRTSLSLSSSEGVPGSLMVTSTQAGEGKSTACYGLATGLSKIGKSVVVVDADLRRPNVHRQFGLDNKMGASNVLSGSAAVEAVTVRAVIPGVDVITAGPIPPNPAELLATGALIQLIEELTTRYDHVIVDSAPVLGLADAPLVASSVAGIVFVIESARTSVRGASSAVTRLTQSGKPVLGVILSRFHAGRSGYAYDYQYAYDYKYQIADN